jgi:SAM-dependent methyltransferase
MKLKRRVIGWCERAGLLEAVHEVQGLGTLVHPATLVGNARARLRGAPDGLPIPPARLVYLVAGTYNVAWFLRLGRAGAQAIEAALGRQGRTFDELGAVLDFGCGCGRVARYFVGRPGVALHGTDYNPRPIAWCRQHLAPARFEQNRLAPPLPYGPGSFDLIYALSVFTHLDEPLQRAWLDELRRVCKPGGYVLISMHGASYLPGLSDGERARFAADELVVRRRNLEGRNICTTYSSEAYTRQRLARPGEVVDFVPEGAKGNPRQDLFVLRMGATNGGNGHTGKVTVSEAREPPTAVGAPAEPARPA